MLTVVKTETGQQVMKDRSVALTPKQRSALILIDGKRTLEQLLQATASVGVTREEVQKLFELGLVVETGVGDKAPAAVPAESVSVAGRSPQQRYAEAYPVATKLTAGLGLRGFRLNLAVEGATNYEELVQVAPKIRDAVGPEKYRPLDEALNGA